MPFNGNGQFDPASPQYPAIADTLILATDWNTIVADIAAGLSLAWTRDGQAGALANLSMGGYRLTTLANAVNPQDAVTLSQATTNVALGGLTLSITATTVTVTSTTLTLPAGTSIGAVSAAELAFLDGVTSAVQTQLNTLTSNLTLNVITLQTNIDAKGAIAGQTWSGNQIFTGAIITVPTQLTGDNSTKAASTAFVVATAFNAALPAQSASTAGKFVSSNGANASWQNLILDPINYLLNVT